MRNLAPHLILVLALLPASASAQDYSLYDLELEGVCPEQVAVGRYGDVCVRYSDGTVECAGPIAKKGYAPPAGYRFTDIDVGGDHACGLLTNEAIACWGDNYSGESVWQWDYFTDVSAGYDFTCGTVRANPSGEAAEGVKCWGADWTEYGPEWSGVISEAPSTGSWTQVSAGLNNACALRDDGSLTCWGGDHGGNVRDVSQVPSGVFTHVDTEEYSACAARDDGTVDCWGNATWQPTGWTHGTGVDRVSVGYYGACALGGGSLACWGDSRGASYTGPFTPRDFSWIDDPPKGSLTDMELGNRVGCALTDDHRLECWGEDADELEFELVPASCLQVEADKGSKWGW